jgi:hypothetical protein
MCWPLGELVALAVGIVGLGLLAFEVYSFAGARYRMVLVQTT